ncbi:hypothetical protein ANCCEY_02524 [Ancylostoma ceylanicum]|uniref:Uncharacterized protein n=1 Tax=Ancylostoma ceylanicum TaxID=53326 RepID=A0A0D6M2C5_9BILA|nr:hypothetical protein ANCCEY_02524 [Ancylostoma ceylanicum]
MKNLVSWLCSNISMVFRMLPVSTGMQLVIFWRRVVMMDLHGSGPLKEDCGAHSALTRVRFSL